MIANAGDIATTTMRSSQSSSLRSRYDFYYSSPLTSATPSAATNFYDNQHASLFGDPVPPSTGFLENLDNHLYGSFRHAPSDGGIRSNSSYLDDYTSRYYNTQAHQTDGFRPESRMSEVSRPHLIEDSVYGSEYQRVHSAISSEFRNNVDNFRNQHIFSPSSSQTIPSKRIFPNIEPTSYYNSRRQSSDAESKTSNEWVNYKASLDDWSNIPRPVPNHGKYVTHVNHGVGSRAFSTDSPSSSDGRKTNSPATIHGVYKVNTFEVRPFDRNKKREEEEENNNAVESTSESECGGEHIVKVEASPAIITDTIVTGSNHRCQPPNRLHKKPSFTIINELSPSLSRAASPTPSNSGRTSPFLGRGFKPSRNHLRHRNSFDSIDHRVTFSNALVSQPRSHSSLALTPRSILQNKNYNNMENYEIQTDAKHTTMIKIKSSSSTSLSRRSSQSYIPTPKTRRCTSMGERKRSFEMLPFITQIPRSNVLSSRNMKTHQKLFRSKTNLVLDERKETTNSKPPVNPRSHHKGFMKVVTGSPSKIPKRSTSNPKTSATKRTQSMSPVRRKSSSTISARKPISRNPSPNTASSTAANKVERKPIGGTGKSATTALKATTVAKLASSKIAVKAKTVTVSKKLTPNLKRPGKKNVLKPPTLSPIIGTPNKDDEPVTPDDKKSTKANAKKPEAETPKSPSKIPVRQPSSSSIDVKKKETSPVKSAASASTPAPKSPTKSIMSLSLKPKFGFSSVSKALTRSFRRKKNSDSDSESIRDSLGSQLSLRRLVEGGKASTEKLNTIAQEADSPGKESLASTKNPDSKRSMFKRSMSKLSLKMGGDQEGSKKNDDESKSTMSTHTEEESDGSKYEKLVPMTKNNVVSMTTAAITAQPIQISTTVTNQMGQIKEPGETDNESAAPPPPPTGTTSILEQSQKTLENVQKTVTTATDEIKKSINENLTNLKSLESDMMTMQTELAKAAMDNAAVKPQPPPYQPPTPTMTTTTTTTASDVKSISTPKNPSPKKHPAPNPPNTITAPSIPIEASVSVINEKTQKTTDMTKPNNNNDAKKNDLMMMRGGHDMSESSPERSTVSAAKSGSKESGDERHLMGSRRSGGNGNGGSRQGGVGGNDDDDGIMNSQPIKSPPPPCCVCCPQRLRRLCGCEAKEGGGNDGCCRRRFCIPCSNFMKIPKFCQRKSRRSKKENRKSTSNSETETRASETDVSTSHTDGTTKSCWKKLNCCRRKGPPAMDKEKKMKSSTRPPRMSGDDTPKRGKCGACMDRVFCCKPTNKIETTDNDDRTKCCWCIPCKKKQPEGQIAWANGRESIMDQPKRGCCASMCSKLNCCSKKQRNAESRRTSMNSKKMSIAPTLPPEDTRPKLDLALVEHSSMMKGAIPVLPICLAYFCGILNFIIPGLGTILSGLFCLCIGKPRFSQHESARARIGSFIINTIVGIAQAFCLLFCLVGYGWSAWWGAIMIKVARKHRKIKQAEYHPPSPVARPQPPPVVAQNHRDVEAGR